MSLSLLSFYHFETLPDENDLYCILIMVMNVGCLFMSM